MKYQVPRKVPGGGVVSIIVSICQWAGITMHSAAAVQMFDTWGCLC